MLFIHAASRFHGDFTLMNLHALFNVPENVCCEQIQKPTRTKHAIVKPRQCDLSPKSTVNIKSHCIRLHILRTILLLNSNCTFALLLPSP